jgi:hypothetical protein
MQRVVELDSAWLAGLYEDFLEVEELVVRGLYGSTIQWQSDNTTYSVDKYGFVTVIDSQKDEEILLVATIAYGNHADQVVYEFVIPADYMLRVVFMVHDELYNYTFIFKNEKLDEVFEGPEKSGYVFLYWSVEEDGDPFDYENNIIKEDLILYAVYEEESSEVEILVYEADFDDVTKGSYETGTVKINEKEWTFDDALIHGQDNDKFNGTKAIRMRNQAEVLMNWDIAGGISKVTFYAAYYGSDNTANKLLVSYSTDAGISWSTPVEITLDFDLEEFSVQINTSVNTRIKFQLDAPSGKRANIDDIRIYQLSRELTPQEKIAAAIAEIDVLEEVVTDLVLPTSGAHGVTIAWSSDNAAINVETGKVTRPAVGEDDLEVTLTATFEVDEVEVVVTYNVVVKAEEEIGEGTYADDLFISEYIEGSSNNKAIEIFNGTGQTVDLSNYSLVLHTNGSATNTQTLQLSGTLAHGEVYVIIHNQANEAIKAVADLTEDKAKVINHNGNDPIALYKGDTLIDIVGTVGSSADFAKDVTLVRNANVTKGSTTYDANEWTTYPIDTTTHLGSHTFEPIIEHLTK